jgi:alpha-tubulin suppressor-like RCC1 family protein
VTAVAGGHRHSLALKRDGTVVGWGSNYEGQASPPAGLTGVTAIAAGPYHSLALQGGTG